jgi:hypothetical protein
MPSFWSAVAERERRHRFRSGEALGIFIPASGVRKRRGATLPAAVQRSATVCAAPVAACDT